MFTVVFLLCVQVQATLFTGRFNVKGVVHSENLQSLVHCFSAIVQSQNLHSFFFYYMFKRNKNT